MLTRYLLLAARVWDDWNEAKHPRKANGQFGKGGVASKSPLRRAAEVVKPKHEAIKLQRAEYARVMSAINTLYHARFKDESVGHIAIGNYYYRFQINGFSNYTIFYRKKLR